ncbi:MAG: aminoacyl-tRNA hydrolase [Chitinophagaceae bacterium]|nr:aminoacyl-tRNA hydrolase [Chitinophagaceae bacterium]
MSRFLIAGLGNPGSEYVHTRHNIGFDIADVLAAKHHAIFKTDRLADMASFSYKGKEAIVIKPSTFMNLSGRSVKYWMDNKKIDISHILVIVDDLALPLSKLRMRPSGSDAGHNGLSSIQESLATAAYPKLRFGIGDNFPKGMQVEFVLGRWTNEEMPLVKLKLEAAVDAIESFIFRGIERTMADVNKKEFIV